MLTVQCYDKTAFQAHRAKDFSEMMTHIYRKVGENHSDSFYRLNPMHVSTKLIDGTEACGIVNFTDKGQFKGLYLDDQFKGREKEFMKAAVDRYNYYVIKRQVQEKYKKH